jgi:solute carrier family 25 phosphate transporter 23/24/25/41
MKQPEIEEIFKKLDKDKKGYLNASDISQIIPQNETLSSFDFGNELVQCCDITKDGTITLSEFTNYIVQKEAELRQLFQKVATDGKVGLVGLKRLVQLHDITIPEKDLELFLLHTGSKGDLDFKTFRDFLLFMPVKRVFEMYQPNVDFNSDAIPPAKSKRWDFFLAGGIAGAVSRTCTAPLDRLKVFLFD